MNNVNRRIAGGSGCCPEAPVARTGEESYLDMMMKGIPGVIILLNACLNVVHCSDKLLERAGFDDISGVRGEHLAKVLDRFADGNFRERLLVYSELAVGEGRTTVSEIPATVSGGGRRVFRVAVAGVGRGCGAMILLSDVTEILDAMETAKRASAAKSDFLSSMSHEIRTPMNAIIGMTAIGRNAKTIDEKDDALEKIGCAGNHLLNLINDVLDMAKIEAKKLELSPVTFSFRRMVTTVENVAGFRLDEKRQRLIVDIDDAIPNALIGDDQKLAQVITNLVTNAIKFSPEGGEIKLKARIAYLGHDECIVDVRVSDRGIGMTEEQRSRLFNSFQQADSGTSRRFGGTGLGLVISKNIVEMMDGSIGVESLPGRGSVFLFTVKLGVGDVADMKYNGLATEGAGGTNGVEEGVFEGRKVLIADDIDINREIIITLLGPTGLAFECAEDGDEVVAMYEASPESYDLILMDVQMPGIDGYEATRRIRRSSSPGARAIPIIAMTASVFKEDVEKSLEAGMNDHLGKPVNVGELMSKLSQYLGESPQAEGTTPEAGCA